MFIKNKIAHIGKKIPLVLTGMIMTLLVPCYAQEECNFELSGIVKDADTKEPLPYVALKVKGTNKSTYTDIEGVFKFTNLCDSNNVLIIKCFGYCDTICKNFHKEVKSPSIYLKQKVVALSEVTITVDTDEENASSSIASEELSKEDLESNPTQSLASVVSDIDGVTLASLGPNVQIPVIHGLYGNRILVLNNGLKHGFQNWGTDHAPEIDINSADRIQIIKGAAGVRYGPEAIGGAIIVEADPMYLNESFKAKVNSGFQTNGKGYFLNTSFGEGLKNWSYHLGATYTKIGDRKAPDYMLSNSGKEEIALNGGLRFSKGQFDISTYYSFVDQNLGILRTSIAESGSALVKALSSNNPNYEVPFSYQINEPNQLTQHHLSKTEIQWYYSDEGSLKLRVGSQLNKRKEFDVRRNADLPIIDLNLTTTDSQLEWNHPKINKIKGTIGLQLFSQNNDNNPGTGTTPFIPNYNTTRYSGYIIEYLKKEKITYELGIRFDNEYNNIRGRETNQEIFKDEYTFTNITASLGFLKRISESTSIRTNLGSAWRTPNMAELYSFGQHGFKVTYGLLRYYENTEGNIKTDRVILLDQSKVKPEKGVKWVNEYTTQKKSNSFKATLYAHYIQNFIFDRPIAVIGTVRGPMPAFIFDQADALFVGTDLTWEKQWTSKLDGTFGTSLLWSQNIEKNEPLINQPPITVNYKLSWETLSFLKLSSSKIYLKPSYTFKQFNAPRTVTPQELINGEETISQESEIFDFKDAPEGYFLIELGWKFKWKNIGGSISVHNTLNNNYRNYLNEMRYFADEMGTNVLFTINYVFKPKPKIK